MSSYSKENKGYKYILAVIDVFSKYGWMIPLKNKSGIAVAEAFNKIKGRHPEKLWVDKGSEFYNKHVKSLFKEIYSTENEEKSSVVERWNRTMKERMFKYFTANNTTKYYNILDALVDDYNNTYHTTIKMTPVEASRIEVRQTITISTNNPKFKVGDRVRITKKKKFFEKGYTPNWTNEIFVIDKVIDTNPVTYKIKDLNNEEIIGSFYEKELQQTQF